MTVPSVTDWAWLGRQRIDDIARLATQKSQPAYWLKEAYAWLYSRFDAGRQKTLPRPIASAKGPPNGFIPVLGACHDDSGVLGFVSVEFPPSRCSEPVEDYQRAACDAAEAIACIFRKLDYELGFPHVELHLQNAGGSSVALSAAIAALINLLSLTLREDVAATGCFDNKNRFAPVDSSTLKNKIKIAEQWAYQRVLVVEGQKGIPNGCGLEIVEVPRNLVEALFVIAREAAVSPADPAIARLLAVFDQAAVRADPRDQDLERTLQITADFVQPTTPELARHVAHDIRSRALLHAGLTNDAANEKKKADDVRPGPFEFPSGWLGNYLKWHQVAHHAVLALDQGRWEDTESEHRLLDRTLERLLGAISDQQAGREELLAALFLSNTRARRLDFLGRWHRDCSVLCRAWDDVTRFRPHWPALFDYCRQIGLRDGDLHRQHNCCLEVLASYWHLKGHLPDSWSKIGYTFWPEASSVEVEQLGPFDLPNLLRWKVISGQEVGVDLVDRILKAARRMFQQAGGSYPMFLAFEAVLRYGAGDEHQRREAAEALAQSVLFSPELPPTSILTLLALRAERLLKAAGCSIAEPVRPAAGTLLAVRADDLLRSPDDLVHRCPY